MLSITLNYIVFFVMTDLNLDWFLCVWYWLHEYGASVLVV